MTGNCGSILIGALARFDPKIMSIFDNQANIEYSDHCNITYK